MVVMNNKRSFGRTHTHTWTQQPRGCMFARAVAAADCTLYRYTMAMNKCWWGRFFSFFFFFFFFFFRRVYRLVPSWERKPQRRKTTGFFVRVMVETEWKKCGTARRFDWLRTDGDDWVVIRIDWKSGKTGGTTRLDSEWKKDQTFLVTLLMLLLLLLSTRLNSIQLLKSHTRKPFLFPFSTSLISTWTTAAHTHTNVVHLWLASLDTITLQTCK